MANQAPNSYKDPYWAELSASAERKHGLPAGLLVNIVTKGERSNNDQVSEAKARTVFQITDNTRKLVMDKYGVDPLLSPENAAESAALLLKESLQRNKGDVSSAVAEYHGGTNRANWGPRTRAYVQRVVGNQPPPQQSGSTFSRALAAQQSQQPPSNQIQQVYEAYASGQMSPQEASEFEADVKAGAVMLPRGAALIGSTAAPVGAGKVEPMVLPQEISDAYQRGQMSEPERAELEADIRAGVVKLPPSMVSRIPGASGEVPTEQAIIERPRAPSLSERLVGAGETALTMLTGTTGGALGSLAGTVEGITKTIIDGTYGTNEGANEAARIAQERAGQFTYAPRTEQGQEQTQAVGEFAARNLAPLGGLAGEMTSLAQGVQAAKPTMQVVGAAAVDKARQGLQSVKPPVVAAVEAVQAPQAARVSPQALDTLGEAERAGVRVMTSDILPPKTFVGRTAQQVGERIPIAGTGGMRAEQQAQRVGAVRNLLSDYGADDAAKATEAVMADLAKKRSGDLTKYASLKNGVIDKLDESGATVPVARATQVIDDEIARLQALKTENFAPVVNRLDDFKQSIQGQGLRNIEELRKQLGESFKSPDMVSVRSVSEKATGKIYGALRQDMGDFIKKSGDRRDITKWTVANKRLSEMASDLDMGVLKSTLSRGDATPEVVNGMLFSKKPSEINALYHGLTPEGRANARAAILKKAADDAMTVSPGGEMVVSPDKFMNNINKLHPSVAVFFKGDELKRVEGLSRVLALTKRAGESAASPPTGVQAMPFVAGSLLADIFGGAGAATISAGSVGLISRALESVPVRNLLLKLAKAPRNSPQEAAIFKQLATVAPSAANTKQPAPKF